VLERLRDKAEHNKERSTQQTRRSRRPTGLRIRRPSLATVAPSGAPGVISKPLLRLHVAHPAVDKPREVRLPRPVDAHAPAGYFAGSQRLGEGSSLTRHVDSHDGGRRVPEKRSPRPPVMLATRGASPTQPLQKLQRGAPMATEARTCGSWFRTLRSGQSPRRLRSPNRQNYRGLCGWSRSRANGKD